MRVTMVAALWFAAQTAMGQEQSAAGRDDLDVTMQIIVDPDAKLPDEVVRKIPLPVRASAATGAKSAESESKPADAAAAGQARAEAARELGRSMSERAKERARDAAEQREEAGRSMAEDHRRNPPRPDTPRPPTPPSRP